ncbi:WD repeat-containing and planar cell polarity effector protein fritz homolog [Notothenia coriiceps]|uniref:WD repeat-containing and planar cell polarity effector protein fritz homolog n=1 Tax=Notothenia coriiceps TaxID=8208 RepID=A0A6I9MG85_9TELE|nr:PREDICTED: WD repeat-containing and planar cell polarity effector protein fritz homolog [Notothenia coriiceps]
MAFCLAELHLWSTKSSLQVKDTDIGTYQYYDKGEPANPLEHHYYNEKLHFCEARGYSWTPSNRRPEKLRDSLKEFEELLQTNTCVHTRWRNKHCCQPLKVLGSLQSEGNPLDCRFSLLQPYQLLTVELPGTREGFWADSCVYECSRGRLHRLSSTRIPLTSRPVSCSRHPSERSLLLGLSDSSLVLFDQRRGVSLLASCPVPPTLLAWHPAGAVVVVGGEQGELMCFDVGLAPVRMALVAEDEAPAETLRLADHLRSGGGLEGLRWAAGLEADVLMLAFHGGPLAALRFRLGALTGGLVGLGEMLQQRLRCGQVREALGVLEAMDWSIMGDECHRGLSSITNHLLRLELNAEREALLEAALGVFYAPPAPLSDVVILEFREPISKCARRFFHHLLRDLHYVASDKGEVVLADVAKRKANEIESAAGNEDPQRVGDDVMRVSRQTERNQTAAGPSYPNTPTTQVDGRANQRRLQAESIRVTVSPLRQTGSSEGDSRNDDEDLGMLHVVHLGMV